jgi:hypothetical protein
MKVRLAVPVVSGYLLFAMAIVPAFGQVNPASVSGAVAACGARNIIFKVKKDNATPAQAPADKALVFLIQDTEQPLLEVMDKVRMGADGKWMGATQDQTYMSFVLDPGTHHLCTSIQDEGDLRLSHQGEFGLQDGIILHRLNVEAGKTYYFRMTVALTRLQRRIPFLEEVDEDEGRFLVQTTTHATSHPK